MKMVSDTYVKLNSTVEHAHIARTDIRQMNPMVPHT